MSRLRIAVVIVLLLGPFLLLAGLGCYFLWTSSLGFIVWWVLGACFAVGYWLAWRWQSKQLLLQPDVSGLPMHWTERDRQAWHLVEARAKAAAELEQAKLTDPQQFLATAQEMVGELAAFYHPNAHDPLGSLTVPELLAAFELAAGDLAELMDRYVPGGHLLSIDDFRRARRVYGWYQSASNFYWIVSAVFAPMNTGLRFLASRYGSSLPLGLLQQNLLVWFYVQFVHRLGTYLIDLNSGRLRVGGVRYRELKARMSAAAEGAAVPAGEVEVEPVPLVVVTLFGQVKTGKSSLINALLGDQRAATDVLPVTNGVER